jgi:hypothetical protein
MESLNPHRFPSAGSLIKKIVEINPDLSVQEVIRVVRQATRKQEAPANGDFASVDVIDEEVALDLARRTLAHGPEQRR